MMATEKFETCWGLLLKNEGGYVVDDGGQTRWGVTARVAYRYGYRGPMDQLPQRTAENIAFQEYWLPSQCDLFATPIAFQILDTVYNGGHPIQWLREIVGGTQTGEDLADIIGFMDVWEVIARFNSKRLQYLASLKQQMYADGRMNRISTNLLQGNLQ
jgi:lysozyme family protein